MKKKHIYISVTGTMGSGKTTAAGLLSRDFGYTLIEENFGENAFLPRFYKDMKRWAFHSQTFFLMEKITQMLETKKILEQSSVIQDTPIEQDVFSYARALYKQGNMNDAEWNLYRKIFDSFAPQFPRPDLYVFLETSIPVLASRVASRGRGYEHDIPLSYIKLLDRLNYSWLSKKKNIPVLSVQTDTLNIVRSRPAQKRFSELVRSSLKNI